MAGLLDAAELADLQADAVGVLDQSCTITRVTSTPTNIGASEATTVVYTGACLLARPSASLLAALGISAVGGVPQWVVTVPSGTPARSGDRVSVVGVTPDVFTIQQPLTPQSYSVLDSFLMAEAR